MFLEHNSNIMLEFQILLCFGNIMFLEHNVVISPLERNLQYSSVAMQSH